MKYILYLDHFNQWLETHALPCNSQLMYFKLLNVFNRAGWPETVQVDVVRLMVMVNGSKEVALRARDRLVEAGLIGYRKGKKGNPSAYHLIPPAGKGFENDIS